ncbi:MAG: hypothetical protein OJF59_001090 [Cytophagales bacterium]|jgi:tetratricopeptide (TPR) repeat protein|nr:tetratricopeptide repeat protein [Bacteroidota bacterium]MBS1979918.1 tetratricopeptide repeat protein [Bacteroidota bacterium]WHZ07337.1 MAG: hypothetical protein OJF59_001090 [Cytophagales bacterium]
MKKYLPILFFLIFSIDGFSQSKQKRLALVIGNSHYQFANPLKNPLNDARAIASSLRSLGFEVMEYEDIKQPQMKQAINEFGQKLNDYDVGLFYYAGHGIQSKGVNYIVPIEADLKSEEEVEFDCVAADRVLAFMDAASTKVNLIILDACRNNPFARGWQRSAGGGGLAMMDAPKGSLIAYATSPGRTASDGESSNGLYTSALLKFMRSPSLTIEQVFKQVRNEVNDKSGGAQIPWETTSLTGEDFYLSQSQVTPSATTTTSLESKANENATAKRIINLKATKVSDDDKAQAEVFFSQGKISYEEKKYEKAIGEFGKAIQLNPVYSDAYFQRGLSYYTLADYDKAIGDFNIAIELNPKNSQAYYWRANSNRMVRQDDLALKDFTSAISLTPNYYQAYYWQGRTYYDLMMDEKATDNFRKALELNPQFSDALFWLGQAYYDQKKFNEAIVNYNEALKIKKADPEILYWRANAKFSLKQWQPAIADFDSAIIVKPGYTEAYFYRGKVKYNTKQYPQALADFAKACELNEKYADSYYWMGKTEYILTDYNKAIEYCNKAIAINENHGDAYYYRAMSLYTLGKYDEAILDFDKSIATQPYADTYYWRGNAKYALQDFADAIPDFSQAIQKGANDAYLNEYYYYRGNSYYSLKMYSNAVKDFSAAITLKQNVANQWYYRGLSYFYLDQKDLALNDINKAIELDPGNSKFTNFKNANFK